MIFINNSCIILSAQVKILDFLIKISRTILLLMMLSICNEQAQESDNIINSKLQKKKKQVAEVISMIS